jgi:simple sugar transport system permease protein
VIDLQDIVSTLAAAIRLSTPLILAALAGLYSERSGVFDIGLEGKMLAGAFGAGAIAALSGSAWVGLAAAIIISVLMALVHGFACITQRGNQIVSGVAINFLASGLTAVVGHAMFGFGGPTPRLEAEARFLAIEFPGAAALRDVPVIGRIYSDLVSGHNLLVYIAFLAVPFTVWVVYRTRFGLRLRAVGENPAAVDTAGISVEFLRYRAVLIAGVLCGIAGAYLSLAQAGAFGRDMTAGQGYIALAALIFANWRPWRVLGACLLFGLLSAVAIRLQGVVLPTIGAVPVQFVQALPYVLTVILLAGFIGKAIPPKAGGIPYVKER